MVIPTHVVNEEKKLWKAAKDVVSCSMPLPEEVEGGGGGGGGGVMIYFISLLSSHPLWPPRTSQGFLDTRISSINGDQERRKLSCGDQ